MPGQKTNVVENIEMGVMQYVIMSKAKEGGVTRENLRQLFDRQLHMNYDHFDHCINLLVESQHIREEGNKLVATDDGREDVEKLQSLFMQVPQVLGTSGREQGAVSGGRMGGTTNPVTQTNQMGGPKGGGDTERR